MTVETNNVIFGPGLLSWVFIKEPKLPKNARPGATPKYRCTILWGKDQVDLVTTAKNCIIQAVINKWGADKTVWPKKLYNPMRDGDTYLQENRNDPGLQYYKGMYFMNTNSEDQPQVVGPDAKPIMDMGQIYPGCTGYLLINFAGYEQESTGIGVYLNGVMKLSDGERLDGRVNAEDAFKQYAVQETPGVPGSEEDLQDFLT